MKRFRLLTVAAALLLLVGLPLAYATLTTSITFNISAKYAGSSANLGQAQDTVLLNRNIELTSGTGANAADVIYRTVGSIGDANTVTYDVYASGTLTDPLGNALTMSAVKILYLKNLSTDATLLVGGGTTPVGIFSDPTDILKVRPGGTLLLAAPDAAGYVTTTNKNIKLAHDGTGSSALSFEMIVVGND